LAIVLVASAAGLAISATDGRLPLATISYKVISNNQNGGSSFLASNGSVVVIAASQLNLGNLTADQKGNATGTAVILVNSSGYFVIELNDSVLHDVFSHFMVKLTIGNQTVTLAEDVHGGGHDKAVIYLNKGEYNVTVTVYYLVLPHPHSVTVDNAPLLIIKPFHGHVKVNPYHGHDHNDQEESNS
jgi:hypothetical protein